VLGGSAISTVSTIAPGVRRRKGFTLIDLLVSIAIIAVLMGIMLPSLKRARVTAYQVVCSSNTRQIGLGLMMYADDYGSHLPYSRFAQPGETTGPQPDKTVIIRDIGGPKDWDGMGLLFGSNYLDAPKVFYCPAHSGAHGYNRYVPIWNGGTGQIVANYQYRGGNLAHATDPLQFSLASDSLRTKSEFNHKVGANVLRGDFSVIWFADSDRSVVSSLPESENDVEASAKIEAAWQVIDVEAAQGK